jgi:hypothetical protein
MNHAYQAIVFSLLGSLFVAVITPLSMLLMVCVQDRRLSFLTNYRDVISLFMVVGTTAFAFSFIPALVGYFTLRKFKHFERRKFRIIAFLLGLLLGGAPITAFAYGSIGRSLLAPNGMLLVFPVLPWILSSAFFAGLCEREFLSKSSNPTRP